LVAGIVTKFFSVVPITEKELEAKREGGVEALFALWDAERKDVVSVRMTPTHIPRSRR
jgi:Suppressor of fused protein (SUFU)